MVMAYPIIRFKKVAISTKSAWTGDIFSTRDASHPDMFKSRSEVFEDFNKALYQAFMEQRKFTVVGLSILALGLVLQLAGT